jgi:sec-independent protein translocase protein TatB
MLDISFSELVVCFLVALIVLGPERLPGVARALGRWTGKARVYMRNFTAELERETQVADLKRQLEDAQRTLKEQANHIESTARTVADEAKALPEQTDTPGEHGR